MLKEILLGDGTARRLGNRVPVSAPNPADWPEFGTTPTARAVPRSEWDGLIAQYSQDFEHGFFPPVKDQDGIGECNPTAAVTMVEFCRAQQGLPRVQLSPADLYARINGGRDEGSLLEDAMAELTANGVGTTATCGELWKRGVFKGEASAAERARFKVTEVFLCPTFDHCMSAVFQGFGLCTGIMWFDNYAPDADGWLPRGGGNAGGHAIMGAKPASRRAGGRVEYGIVHQNSWGENWGRKGRFVIPEVAYSGGAIGGWWAARSVTDEGGIVPVEVI